MPELRTETMTVNMGRSTRARGVRLVLELDGEVVSGTPRWCLHRHRRARKEWQQVVPLIERTGYLGAQSNSAYALSSRSSSARMPDRVKWIRALAELQRINSHLVWLDTRDGPGAVSVMLYCFRERSCCSTSTRRSPASMFPSYIRIGGLREDLPGSTSQSRALERMPKKLGEYGTCSPVARSS
jgi:NADH:ubiquinone oxidoreductase subunit D